MTLAPSIPAREMMRVAQAFPRGRLSGTSLQRPGPAGHLELRSGGFLPPQGEKPLCPPKSQANKPDKPLVPRWSSLIRVLDLPASQWTASVEEKLSPLRVSFKIISVLLQITNTVPAGGRSWS